MSRTDRARAEVQALLPYGEVLHAFEGAGVRVGDRAKQAAKDVAVSTAASVVVGAVTGFGMMRMTIPPCVWLAITDRRVLMFTQYQQGRKPVGNLVFDAPRASVTVTEKTGLLNEVTVWDAMSGQAVVRLGFGMRKRAFTAVVHAAA